MSSRLRKREFCPLHRSFTCSCHGPAKAFVTSPRKKLVAVERIEDPHHPRGYREICSPAELRRRKNKLILNAEGHPVCHLCGQEFTSYSEIALEHKLPKKMGGSERDDHFDNLALAHHYPCNFDKGSRRIA